MIDSNKFMEKFLQNYRFKMVKKYISGDVLDFGGNKGELEPLVEGEYILVDYDHSPMKGKTFDTIVSLAVIEHIEVPEVYRIFQLFSEKHLRKKGIIFITTPTPLSKPILEFMAWIGILDKENIAEHKHYWSKKDIYDLAKVCNFKVIKYKKFQGGVNQYAVFKRK